MRERLAADTGLEILPPADPFEAQANRDGLVEASGALKSVAVSLTKIANDLRWMGSGPRAGWASSFLPELQKGSSIMPGKVNPVIPEVVCQVSAQVIGNDTAITVGGLQGNFELNVQIPLMARNLLQSIGLLASACRAVRRAAASTASRPTASRAERYGEATLAMATALNPYIGYDRATAIVKDAAASGRSLREVAREHGVEDDGARQGPRPAGDGGREPGDLDGRRWCSSTSRASRPASSRTCCSSAAPRSIGSSWTRASRCPSGAAFDAIVAMGGPMRSTTRPSTRGWPTRSG